MTHMVLREGLAAHWIAANDRRGLANASLPPLCAYCKLTRPKGACFFISVGHFSGSGLRRQGGESSCSDMTLQRVGRASEICGRVLKYRG
jgi:hypothetical protein